jgi:hypothetical protein
VRHRVLSPLPPLLAILLLPAPPASASRAIAPPGNAGVGQYVEVVPGAGGSTPVGAPSSHGPVLSAAERRRLEAAGGSGKALASFVQRTGVAHSKGSSSKSTDGHSAGRSGNAAQGAAGASSRSLPTAVADRATRSAGGGGLGWGLPVALVAVALAAAAIAVVRRRTA